jgi:hypothetical protein
MAESSLSCGTIHFALDCGRRAMRITTSLHANATAPRLSSRKTAFNMKAIPLKVRGA